MEQKLDEYFNKFGKNYPLMITENFDEEDVIKDIDECIARGIPKEDPVLDEDLIY